ncbi:uncharacterized protein LOC129573089 [Sitodiplosis mosellana]|uniref:uncharacterized protein LOC129573089 n=1 Tax=Sitodiplosis mosellana TaxID=263140 RepID=UPI0024449D20|nr:uncharacterized protein LOC129573089 [Sitodiplosis mosellana]
MEKKSPFFVNPIKIIKTKWNVASPYRKLRFFYKFGLFLGDVVQIRVFGTRPYGILAYLPAVTCVIHYALIIYTVYYHTSKGNFADCLPTFCVFGCITSSYAAYCSVVINKLRLEWYRLLNISGKLIYRDDNEPIAYNLVCSQSVYRSMKRYVIMMTLILLASLGAVFGPFYSFVHEGSFETLYNLKLPYFNQYPSTEFAINIVWESFVNLFDGIFGFLVIELVIAICNDTIFVSSKLTELELSDLSNIIEEKRGSKAKQVLQLKMILMRVLHMDEYINSFRNIMYPRNFVAPPSFSFAIAVSIYSQLMMGYPGGYGLAVVSYVQMFNLCYSGQNIENRNQRLQKAFYDFKWYLLAKEDQRDLMQILLRMQNGVRVTIGPFEPLNYETLKTLTQRMYSFLMYLVNIGV